MRNEVIEGIASVLWQSAWYAHVLAHDCVTNASKPPPAPPWEPVAAAKELLSQIEIANHMTIEDMWALATFTCINGECEMDTHTTRHFGECIAHARLGTKVQWSTNHEPLGEPIVSPDKGELQENLETICGDRCKRLSRSKRRRLECGHYSVKKQCHACE